MAASEKISLFNWLKQHESVFRQTSRSRPAPEWSVHPQERRSFLLLLSAVLQAQLRSQECVPRRVTETAATHPGVIARHGNV